jgi:hypothetical protein
VPVLLFGVGVSVSDSEILRSLVGSVNASVPAPTRKARLFTRVAAALTGLALIFGSKPRAALADSLCPGLFSVGLSALLNRPSEARRSCSLVSGHDSRPTLEVETSHEPERAGFHPGPVASQARHQLVSPACTFRFANCGPRPRRSPCHPILPRLNRYTVGKARG